MKKRILSFLTAALVLTLASTLIFSCASAPKTKWEAGKTYTLTVLHTNDHHGTVLPNGGLGGLAERATFVSQIRESDTNVLVLDAGDINTGSALSNMFKAEVDIKAYNMIGYDAVALGNHEFDTNLATLEKQIEWAEFPWISANVLKANGKPLVNPYIIKEYDGIRVGIFGLTTLRTTVIASPDKSLIFADEVETAQKMVNTLRGKEKCDLVILVGHLGLVVEAEGQNTSEILAQKVSGIDLIIDGHSHTKLEEAKFIGTTPIVQANEHGKFMGKAHFEIVDGKVTSFNWKPVAINTADTITYPADPAVAAMIAPYKAEADIHLKQVVAQATDTFVFGDRLSRYIEMSLGNMINDGAVWYAKEILKQDIDFAFTNGGNIRTLLQKGDVTREHIATILPFDNINYITTMKGSDIIKLFEFIASIPQGAGGWAQVSAEARYTIDYSAGKDKGILKDLTIKGKPVDPNAEYSFLTNDYLMGGGDGYTVLANNISSFNTSSTLRDVVTTYVEHLGTLTPYTDGRITVINGVEIK